MMKRFKPEKVQAKPTKKAGGWVGKIIVTEINCSRRKSWFRIVVFFGSCQIEYKHKNWSYVDVVFLFSCFKWSDHVKWCIWVICFFSMLYLIVQFRRNLGVKHCALLVHPLQNFFPKNCIVPSILTNSRHRSSRGVVRFNLLGSNTGLLWGKGRNTESVEIQESCG